MASECCRGRARRGRAGSGLAFALGLALAPKCPMCLAAYLSVFGLGMAAASALAPWCLPLAVTLVLASAASWALRQRQAAKNRHERLDELGPGGLGLAHRGCALRRKCQQLTPRFDR